MIDFDFRFETETEIESLSDVQVIPLEDDAATPSAGALLETADVPVSDSGAAADDDAGVGSVIQSGSDDADIFLAGDVAPDVDGLAHVTGFAHGQDIIDFSGLDAIADSDFASSTADDFAGALAAANAIMAGTGETVVAVQVGDDVIVFADTGDADQAGSAILLVGRTLSDVGAGDFG